nr:reverse transcriptase domain-containing protein [Tanacetum cinerariifolium]
MRTRSSSNLVGESSPNPTFLNLKRRKRRRSKKPFILEESLVDTMADQRTMAELLRAPTEGYAEAQAACRWLEKEPSCSILTWEDLVSKFINEFYPPSRTINLRNEISNFQQQFDESLHEAWDRYKDLIRACPHHGFTELHQLDTFYNALNPADQDSLNSAAGGNLLERRTQDVLTIIETNPSDVTAAMTAILKQFQATPPPAFLKAVEEICVTCGGAHLYYQFVPLSELEKIKKMNEINIKAMQTQINNVKNKLRNEMKTLIQASMSNQTNELKNMMASFFQINTSPTSGSGPLLSNTIANPKAVILKKLPEKLGDPGKFLIPCSFSELNCKALADLARIARYVFVSVGKFTFTADFFIVDYESDPRVPLILGRSFLQTARALIDVHGEEMILYDGDERLTLNMRHDTSSYSNQPQKESINMINIYDDSCEDYLEDLFATNQLSGNPTFSSHPDLTLSEVINLSGNPTSSSPDHLLKEFADELALITFLSRNDDLPFDIEYDLREIEYLLNHDPTKEMDSILKDLIDESNLVDPNDNLVDTIPEMFTDEHTLDYSSLPLYDDFNDDLDEFESNNDDVYNDPFDSKEDKIK